MKDMREIYPQEKPIPEMDIESGKDLFNNLSAAERHCLFESETGKRALVRGKITRIYRNWEADKCLFLALPPPEYPDTCDLPLFG